MDQLLQWIGTFASIFSVPLAIYFYFKTMDGKYEKVRKELINLFSNYIGSGNELTYFYLSSVINAKLRENNLKSDSITIISITEDLIVEIISNALLSNDSKETILADLENITRPINIPDGKLAGDNKLSTEKDMKDTSERRKKIAEALRKGELVDANMDTKKEKETILSKKGVSVILSWVSIIATVVSFLISSGQVTELFSVIDLTSTIAQILIGVVASVIASIIYFLLGKVLKRK